MSDRVETVVLIDQSSGRIHEAIRVNGGEPMVHDACNVVGERTYLDDLPSVFDDADLCQRCFGKAKAT